MQFLNISSQHSHIKERCSNQNTVYQNFSIFSFAENKKYLKKFLNALVVKGKEFFGFIGMSFHALPQLERSMLSKYKFEKLYILAG